MTMGKPVKACPKYLGDRVEKEELVARRREVQELHVLLQQKALPEAVGRQWRAF
jgi:hypothetical protein